MTMTDTTPAPNQDMAKIIDDFDRRIHALEMLVTSTAIMGQNNTFAGGIVVSGTTLDSNNPNNVGSVVATPGTFYDNIFCDVTWVESGSGTDAVSFDVELEIDTTPSPSAATYTLATIMSTAGTHVRFEGLNPNWRYRVRVWAVSQLGVRPSSTPAWTNFTTGQDSTVPAAPTGILVGRGATTVVVKFTPLTAAQSPDVANGNGIYEINVDTSTAFNTGNLRSTYTSQQVYAFNDLTTEGTWYARVRAIDSSGNVGAWSATSSSILAGGVNDSMIIADINAAKITAGTILATVIGTHDYPINMINTSTLTATTISLGSTGRIEISTGGDIKIGNPTTNGIFLNASGIFAYGSSVQTLSIDAATGNISIKGALTSGSTITGTAISAGTISSAAISAGTISGTTITTSTLDVNSPTTNGIRINSSGLNAYKSSVNTLSISSTGDISMSGATITAGLFRTAASGLRIEIDSAGGFTDEIRFRTGLTPGSSTGNETQCPILRVLVTSNRPQMQLNSGSAHSSGGNASLDLYGGYSGGNNSDAALKANLVYIGDNTASAYGGNSVSIACTGSVYVTSPELVVFGGTINVYDSGYGMHVGGSTLASTYKGDHGGNGAGLMTRGGGNALSVGWSNPTLSFFIDGSSVKTFVIPHPVEEDKLLVHATLEGRSADVYYRGRGELVDGVGVVTLPNYFAALCDEESADAYAFPVGGLKQKVVAGDVVNGRFAVSSNFQTGMFRWLVIATRKDVKPLEVEPLRSSVIVKGTGPYTYI